MLKERSQVAKEDQWNVDSLYPSLDSWKKEFDSYQQPWIEFLVYKDKLGESPQNLKAALDALFKADRTLSKLYTYAHLKHDEDIANDTYKSSQSQIMSVLHAFQQHASWFEPQLLSLPEETIKKYMVAPELKDYQFHLEKIFRMKKHTLTHEQEEILALSSRALHTAHKAFSALNDADFKFGSAKDAEGKEHPLTHGSFAIAVRSHDRTLRKSAFETFHNKYFEYENTLCELLDGQMQAHLFNAKARNFDTCLEAALYPKNIDTQVYHALVKAVEDNIGVLHKYYDVRKKVMGLSDMHLYDIYVPLTPQFDMKMSYTEAEDIVIESVAPLGSEYQNLLRKGFKDQRWVDRYENKNKRSGAYSSGCYDSSPYILMNYKELIRDVFTLAHEAGHSMHSLMSHTHQPYQYGDYPIFLAEVASTFNEELLMRLLLQRAKSKEEKIFLVNQKLEDIRGTLFRQTMFAEFELLMHTLVEQHVPLTPTLLKNEYRKLNTKYFGPNVVIDESIDIEWARIPHFYYNFYVYQYATGISAALALADRVLSGGQKERDEYLSFLKAGCSKYPIDTLKMAGVDMRSPQPVAAAIQRFGGLVDELSTLTK